MSAARNPSPWSAPDDPRTIRDALEQAVAAVDQGHAAVGSEWLRYAAELVAPYDEERARDLERAAVEVATLLRHESRVVRAMVEPPPLPQPAQLPDAMPLPLLSPIEPSHAEEWIEAEYVAAEELVEDDEPTWIRHIPMPAVEDPQSEIVVTSLRVAVVADRERGALVCRPLDAEEPEPGDAVAMLVAPTSFDADRLAELLEQLA